MKRIIIALCFAALAFFSAFFEWFGSADSFVEDVLCHRPDGTRQDIRIIAIDENSLNQLGDFSQWDRNIYADLVEKLCVSEDIKPAVIGFDVLFSDSRGDEGDRRFAEACRRHGNTVCAFSYVFSKELVTDDNGDLKVEALHVTDKVVPYEALYEATEHGFANALTDKDDGVIRSSFLDFYENGRAEYSFNAAVYNAYMKALGKQPEYPETTNNGVFSFRYSGKSGEFETVSLCDVLNGNVPAEAFSGCVVLIGAAARGMMDAYSVPTDKSGQMYGVEIHANIVQALIEGKFVHNAPKLLTALIAALLLGIAAFFCSELSVGKSWVICGALIAARLIAAPIMFSNGISAEILTVPAAAFVLGIFLTALHYYIAYRSKQKIEHAFRKYVAPQVVSEIAKSGNYEVKLGGENRNIACLFVDIRGFTPLSESLEPEQVVEILNSYLKLTTSCIFKHGGTLDKFIGDATMAVFNAPFDLDDYVYRAVLTAWDIVKGGEAIEAQFIERFGKSVGFGVGVNCGPAVVGNIGCDFRMDYTAIGDTVNTSARLEANAPRGKVYISEAVYEQVKDRITVEDVGEIPLKGKSKGVFVYSVTGINEEQI